MRFVIATVIYTALAQAQTQISLKSQSKNVDFSAAVSTLPSRHAASDPASCQDGEAYWNTTLHKRRDCSNGTWVDAAGAGSGASTGNGAPTSLCNGSKAGALYADLTAREAWWCDGTAWQKQLSTNNTGTYIVTGQTGTTPAVPAAGSLSWYGDSAAKVFQSIDDAGNKGTMVRPNACVGQVVQSVSAAGVITCIAGTSEHRFLLYPASGAVLLDTDDLPAAWRNHSGASIPITQVWCETDSATALTMQLQKNDGSPANMLSANLSCSSTEANTTGFVAGENVLADGDGLNYLTVSAGGGATWVAVHFKVN
jgi:hypothetical protein